MFDFPTQYVEIKYQLESSDSSTAQRLTPSYGISLPFAILDPSFLIGNLGGSISYNQNELSSSSGQSASTSVIGYEYNVGGIFLKPTKTPVTFFANSMENKTQLDFAPPSNITYNSAGINGLIKNKVLPMSYSFRHDDTKTDSGTTIFETVQNAADFRASNNFRDFMNTSVNASYQKNKNTSNIAIANTTTNQATLDLNNTLLLNNFSKMLGALSSNFFYQDTTGSFPIKSLMFTESYDSSLGKGLKLGGSYTIGSTSTTFQKENVSAGQIYLEHRLLSSLLTRLTGSFNDTTYSTGGGNSVTSGIALLNYRKMLPLDALLQLEASDGITIRDSRLNSTLQTQLNELITVVSISQLYPLQNPRVTQIIEVRDKNTNQLFVTPNDYGTQVIGQTTFITINPTGAIHTGVVLSVIYEFQSDPSVKYSTNTVSASASYSLFKGKYLFQTQYSNASSTLISGGQGSFVPPESKLYRALARANLEELILGAEYRSTDNFSTKQDTFEEYVYYYKIIGLNILGLQVSDSYDTYSSTLANGSGSSGAITNTLTIGTNWSRPLFLNGRMQLTTNYQMLRGTQPGRDYLTARINYDLPLGKFRLHLDAYSIVRMADNTRTTTNNNVNISVRRYF